MTLKAGCIGKYGKNWVLNPGTSSQGEGYSSKWLINLASVWGTPAYGCKCFPMMNVHGIP